MRRDSLYVLCRLTPEDAAELSALEEKCFPSFWTVEQYAKALGKGSPYLSLGCRMDGRLAGYITVSEVAGELGQGHRHPSSSGDLAPGQGKVYIFLLSGSQAQQRPGPVPVHARRFPQIRSSAPLLRRRGGRTGHDHGSRT